MATKPGLRDEGIAVQASACFASNMAGIQLTTNDGKSAGFFCLLFSNLSLRMPE